ncbi:MAG: sigma-70 family RNA polymerase sigma factor [Oscillospiraceae bacterium]|nr:sigma-70 family RNA polymerase sigma factor [Oscillospiraceae bacterium]
MTDDFFIQTYEKYRNNIYSVILNYVRNDADAVELQQEVFMKFYSYKKDFETDEHLKAWLIRVAINLCKNHLRDNKRITPTELDENIPAPENEDFSDILVIVLDLPEKYRIPIHLFYYEEYSIKQISEALGILEATVKTRLNRGKNMIKKILEKKGEDYGYKKRISKSS